jgi:hypothetical protein
MEEEHRDERKEDPMHWDDAEWWGWLPMSLSMIAIWGLLIWGIIRLAGDRWPRRPHRPAALRTLDERLARGEIDVEEYRRRRALLEDEHTRARREGRSINAVATEILDAAAEADRGDRRTRLRAAAAAAGTLRPVPAARVGAARRRRILASTKGLGPQLDRLLAEERERG